MLDFQQKKQLSILVKIAMVDEDFADAEKAVIQKISNKYGATEAELQEIIDAPSYTESLAPMSVIDKMDFMMDCMLVVLADETIANSEEYFVLQMAKKLGFSPDVVGFLIENKNTSREEMKELLLPYLLH
ncbi:TerB family tellurite resistance protein [Marinoscillum pacificum]|uniref:TerB family tellurite resistance protein n=1 Tax=Marinoscillum pacificum TaxID=392723 RepID=UPI0021580C89|nr:TerB family tellurite resistance protein [Marinoscillum pacificum]